jgi:IS5 family transposase
MGFRHLLETHELPKALLKEVNALLRKRGLLMNQGTLIDATLIAAPSSTKNKKHERDPAMHQTQKGNQWHFGMKAHIGADDQSNLVHTVTSTATNVSDVSQTATLMRGEERRTAADAGYVGATRREEVQKKLHDMSQEVRCHIAKRRKPIKEMVEGW